jgi:hypothetical protein
LDRIGDGFRGVHDTSLGRHTDKCPRFRPWLHVRVSATIAT